MANTRILSVWSTAVLRTLAISLFSITICNAQTTKPEKWREDLEYMAQELEIRHTDMYRNVSRDVFNKAKSKLKADIPKLTDNQIIVEFARLVAMIGDGHTSIFFSSNRMKRFRRYPIELWYASDGLIVIAASHEYKNIVGMKIKRIGRGSVDEVVRAVKPLLPLDNQFAVEKLVALYVRVPELLNALGFVENMEQLELTVEDAQGQEHKMNLTPVAQGTKLDWRMIQEKSSLPLWLRRRDEKYWFEYLEDSKTVYLQFNSADVSPGKDETDFIAFCDRLVEFIENQQVEKLIVDLRWNTGGNPHRTRHLLNAVIRADKVNRAGKLFTVISNNTYSAAIRHASWLEQFTRTLFVGEPTGGRPNHSGELRRFYLPNNGDIEIRYSAIYDRPSLDPADNRPAIVPHLKAELSSTDYRNGIDPALQAIAAYKPKQSLDVLREITSKDGIQAAVKQYEKLKAEHYNEYDFSADELNRLGYSFLQSGRFDDAIAIFKLYVEEFPYSADAYDSLGEAYMHAGKNNLAIGNFKRAFELDKRFTSALENMRRLQKILDNKR